MLEQLYFTWSTVGLGDVPGLRVRAASVGVSNINGELYNSFKPYLNYNLPQGTDSYVLDGTLDSTPVSLIFADTGKARVLLQKIYKGKDKYNRPGVYFAHLLSGLPEEFLARDAIDLWRSQSWITDVGDEHPVTLSQLQLDGFKRRSGTLNEYNIESVKQYLPWLIQAYLTLGEIQKIYIAAPNSQAAILIWGLAHSLPQTLQQTLTFSTYEQDVTKSALRVVCTSQPAVFLQGYAKPAQWLPSECYSGKGVAIDCYSGRTSDLNYVSQEIVDYSRYATNCFLQGRRKELDELLTIADNLETKDTNEFLVVCKFYSSLAQGKALTPQEVTGLLSNKKLVTALLHQEKVQQFIIDLAIADASWWDQQAAPALAKLRPAFNTTDKQTNKERAALTAFGVYAAKALYTSMLHNQTQSSEILMRVLHAITPPDKDVAPWLQLLQSFTDHMAQNARFVPTKAFDLSFRSWLLQQWTYGVKDISEEAIFPWLQFTWAELGNFLALQNIPDRWQQLAIFYLFAYSPETLPKQLASFFNNPKYQAVCIATLKGLMRDATMQPAALRCFQKLVETRYGNKLSLLVLLLDVKVASKNDRLTPERLNEFLHAAQLNDREKIDLLQQHASLLLESDHRTLAPTLVDAINVYVDKLTIDKLLDKSAAATLQVLDLLSKQLDKLPSKKVERLNIWIYISYGVVRNPFMPIPIDKKFLTAMGQAIAKVKLQTHKKYRESLFLLLVNSIKTNTDLRCVCESLAPSLATRQTALLFELATTLGERYTSNLSHQRLLPYIYEALDYATSMKAAEEREDFLSPLFKVLLQSVDREGFERIDNDVAKFPSAYKKEWQQYAVPPDPKSLLRKVGDFGGNMIGGAIGGIGGMFGGGKDNASGRSPSRPLPPSPESSAEGQAPPPNKNGQGNGQNQPNRGAAPTQHSAPNANYLQGGQSSPLPSQNPVPVPPPHNILPIDMPTQNMPPLAATQYNQSAPDVGQQYTSPPQEEPQSTVNGKPIYPQWIVMVNKLKVPYIEYREKELKRDFADHLKKKLNTDWIGDEQSLLRNLFSSADILKLLEMDVIVHSSLIHFSNDNTASSGSQLDPTSLLEKAYNDKALQKLYKGYAEEEVKNVLLVFIRYRMLSEYFRNQNPPVRLRHWLEKQWLTAGDQGRIVRSAKPLPNVKS